MLLNPLGALGFSVYGVGFTVLVKLAPEHRKHVEC